MYNFPIRDQVLEKQVRVDIEKIKQELGINELFVKAILASARRCGIHDHSDLTRLQKAIHVFVLDVINPKIQDVLIDRSQQKSHDTYYMPPTPNAKKMSLLDGVFKNEFEEPLRLLVGRIYTSDCSRRSFFDFKYTCVKNVIWHTAHLNFNDFT